MKVKKKEKKKKLDLRLLTPVRGTYNAPKNKSIELHQNFTGSCKSLKVRLAFNSLHSTFKHFYL